MERHQRLQRKKIDRSSSTSIDRSSKLSPFSTRGFGVQQKASTSTPASKTELWENYQRSTQMGQNGSQKTVLDRSTPIQAKLKIGQPGDKYEQEADSVADRVMAMSEPAQVQREELGEEEEELQMKPLAGTISPLVQREELPQEEEELQMKPEDNVVQREELPEEEELQMKSLDNSIQREELPEEEEDLQMKQSSPNSQLPTPNSLESQLSNSKGGGSPLSDDVRSFMEPRFGADFSGVRVHTGSDAVQMNRDVNAQAFAHGSDVYFGAGKAPGKDALTAHELTHVVQQTGGNSFAQTSSLQRQKKRGSPRPPTQTNFTVQNKTYPIEAKTLQEVADLISQREEAGETTWNPRFTLALDENGVATNVTVNVPISVTLPNWPGAAKLSRAAKAEWDRSFSILKVHEEKHVQLVRTKLTDVATSLVGKSQAEAEIIFAEALAELKKSSDDYDTSSDHGKNEGTTIDTSIGAPPPVKSD